MSRCVPVAAGLFAALTLLPAAARQPAPEVHVVALHEGNTKTGGMIHGGKAAVRVDRPGKTVTLVLSAYDPVTWEVTVAEKTKLDRVVLCGYHRQAVTGVPAGVEVVEAFHEGRDGKEYFYFPYKMDSARLRPSVLALNTITGREITSFQGTYRFDPQNPFVVDAVQNDPRLDSRYPRVTLADEVPEVRFKAVRAVANGRGDAACGYGEFTRFGPDKDSLVPLPGRIVHLAHDPAGKKYYGLTDHEFHEVDLEKRTSKKLDPGPDVPPLSWPCGIAFDTKRERVVVATFGGKGYLYEYTPKTGAWAVVADLNTIDLAGLCYHPADDSLYGLTEKRGDHGGTPVLYQFNAKGAVTKTVELGPLMFPGLIGRGPTGCHVQVVSAGDYLAVVVVGPLRPGEDRAKPESFLFLVDPKTGKVKLAWKE